MVACTVLRMQPTQFVLQAAPGELESRISTRWVDGQMRAEGLVNGCSRDKLQSIHLCTSIRSWRGSQARSLPVVQEFYSLIKCSGPFQAFTAMSAV
jgi:hypothetical protein